MSSKFNFWQVKPTHCTIFVSLLCILCMCISQAVAINHVSYKEDATISPKRYKDKLTYKKGYKTISTNNGSSEDHFRADCKGSFSYKGFKAEEKEISGSKLSNLIDLHLMTFFLGELPKFMSRVNSVDLGEPYFMDRAKPISPGELKSLDRVQSSSSGEPNFLDSVKSNNPGEQKFSDRVKSVSPGEKTMRQSDDDDDDDDDGGEYEGLGDSGNISGKTLPESDKNNPVPVMIIRQLDMVAMGIPMKDSPRDKGEDKTGDVCKGVQGRWRTSCRERAQSALGAGPGYNLMP